MTDEESFEVLGSSSTTCSDVDSKFSELNIMSRMDTNHFSNELTSSLNSNIPNEEVDVWGKIKPIDIQIEGLTDDNSKEKKNSKYINQKSIEKEISIIRNSECDSIAAKFLLGEIDPKILHESMFVKEPSLCSSFQSPDDIMKLKKLIFEYCELKVCLQKSNRAIKENYMKMQKFRDILKINQSNLEKIKIYEDEIEKSKFENLELKIALNKKKGPSNSVNCTSSSHSIFSGNDKIKRIDDENLAQELLKTKESLRDLEAKIENLEKENLQNTEIIRKYEREMADRVEERIIWGEQINAYKEDFNFERSAREKLKEENEKLIGFLRNLQAHNEQLIKENERLRK